MYAIHVSVNLPLCTCTQPTCCCNMLVDMCMLLHVCSMQPAKGNMLKRILLTYSLLEQVSFSGRCTINCKNHLTQCPLIVDSWTWYGHGANIMYSSRASHHHIAWLVDFRLCQFSVCLCVPDGPYVSQGISCFVFILLWDMHWRIWMCFEWSVVMCVCWYGSAVSCDWL